MSLESATTPILPGLAITGTGLVSAAGAGRRAFREALRAGRSHLGPVRRLEAAGLAMTAGGAVPDDAAGAGPATPGEDRLFSICARAVEEALAESGLREAAAVGKTGISLGTALGSVEELERLVGARRGGKAAPRSSALRRRAVLHHDLTTRLAARFGLRGPRSTFSMTCASALCALEQAACDLRFGRARAMLVGGADLLSVFMQAGFCSLKALSPSGRLRPFERAHDGIVLGEGAGFVLLEPAELARRRGARIQGLVLGNRLISDGSHLTSPDESGRGMARAISLSLQEAGVAPEEIGAVTVTASGSPVYDRMQSRAVRSALGKAADRIPVTTWEPAVGHALASTAAMALIHAALVLEEGQVPSAGKVGELDPQCTLRYLTEGPVPFEGRAVLALTVGFGGQNGATVVGEEAPAAS